MWSFKSLEIVCQKEDALNFQNFTTIENGFQKIQTFPFLTFFLSLRVVQMKLQDLQDNI